MTKPKIPSNNHNQRIGKWGEQTAIDFLILKGYLVMERNVYTPYGEIDIVAQKDNNTIFIEVKTRTSTYVGYPEDAVNSKKRDHMEKAAKEYAAMHQIENYQLDVIAIEGSLRHNRKITHFENI